jgi:hypothetical protein
VDGNRIVCEIPFGLLVSYMPQKALLHVCTYLLHHSILWAVTHAVTCAARHGVVEKVMDLYLAFLAPVS